MKPIGQVDWLVHEEAHPAVFRPLPTTELNEINVVGFMALFYMHKYCLHDLQITHTLFSCCQLRIYSSLPKFANFSPVDATHCTAQQNQ